MIIKRVGALLAVVVVASGCSSAGTATTAPSTATASAAASSGTSTAPSSGSSTAASAGSSTAASAGASSCQGVTLTIATVQDPVSDGIKAIKPLFEKASGATVNIVELPYADEYTKLVTAFQANDATYDLINIDDPWMPKFGSMNALADLGALGVTQDPDIPKAVWDVGMWPTTGPVPPSETGKTPKLYAATDVANVEMFTWRKDLVPTAPKTWADVLTNAKAQNKSNFAGYVIRGKATNPVVADFAPILWSFGGDFFDNNWNVTFDNAQGLAAVKFFVEDLKSVAQADPANSDAGDRDRLIAVGQAFESTFWPGEVTGLVGAGSTVDGKMGFAPMPAGPSGTPGAGEMGNWMLAIPAASKNQACAGQFVQYSLTKDSQNVMAGVGGIPSRTSVLSDPQWQSKYPQFAVLAAALAAGPHFRPRTDQWNAIQDIVGRHLNAALAGSETAQDVVSKSAAEIRTLMQGAGYPTK